MIKRNSKPQRRWFYHTTWDGQNEAVILEVYLSRPRGLKPELLLEPSPVDSVYRFYPYLVTECACEGEDPCLSYVYLDDLVREGDTIKRRPVDNGYEYYAVCKEEGGFLRRFLDEKASTVLGAALAGKSLDEIRSMVSSSFDFGDCETEGEVRLVCEADSEYTVSTEITADYVISVLQPYLTEVANNGIGGVLSGLSGDFVASGDCSEEENTGKITGFNIYLSRCGHGDALVYKENYIALYIGEANMPYNNVIDITDVNEIINVVIGQKGFNTFGIKDDGSTTLENYKFLNKITPKNG